MVLQFCFEKNGEAKCFKTASFMGEREQSSILIIY